MLTEVSKLQISMDMHRAPCRTQRARDNFQEGSFTRTVLPDDTNARLQIGSKIHIAEYYVSPIVTVRDFVELQYRWTQWFDVGEVEGHFALLFYWF